MGKEFYIRVLKPVPKKFRGGRVFEDTELSAAGLELVYNAQFDDRYHVPVKSRSVYASMDDIKKYLEEAMPGAVIGNWGMRHIRGVYHCHGADGEWSHDIPDDVVKGLERPHIADVSVILCEASWSVQNYGADYLVGKCPMYLTRKSMDGVIKGYLEHLKSLDMEDLSYEVTKTDPYTPNIIGSLCAARAYAEKVGGIGYIEWE